MEWDELGVSQPGAGTKVRRGQFILPYPAVFCCSRTQEIVQYLTHMKNFWSTLRNHDRNQMARIDQHTVDTLQLR